MIEQRPSKFASRFIALAILGIAPLAVTTHAAAAEPAATTIPELAWEQRSDWINVKTAVATGGQRGRHPRTTRPPFKPPRQDSGRRDDLFSAGHLPHHADAGKFRYGGSLGVTLLGHGRTTILAWDGHAGGRMFWTRTACLTAGTSA